MRFETKLYPIRGGDTEEADISDISRLRVVSLDKRALSVYHVVKLGSDFQPSSVRSLASRAEKILPAEHTSTLATVRNLGILYSHQGKLALEGFEKAVL